MLNRLWQKWESYRSLYPEGKDYRLFILTIVIGMIVCILSIKAFMGMTEALHEELLNDWDYQVSVWIHDLRNPIATKFMLAITELGNVYGYLALILLITWYSHYKERGWRITIQIVVVLVSTALLNLLLKFLINRERPQGVEMFEAGGLSFPSGHAMGSLAFYGFIIFLVWVHFQSNRLRWIMTSVLLCLILLIGFTRVYLGVHFPSDVIAGYVAGLGWLALCVWTFTWINHARLRKLHFDTNG